MIFDRTLQFSNAQAVIADAASTNILDLRALGKVYGHAADLKRDLGIGRKIPLLAQIVEAFNNLTTIEIQVQVSVDEAFTSPIIVHRESIALAAAIVGKQMNVDFIMRGVNQRYLRLFYDITGTAPSTGKITAGVVAAIQPSEAGAY